MILDYSTLQSEQEIAVARSGNWNTKIIDSTKNTEGVDTTVSARLINGECLAELEKLESGSVDLILCDLPYGTTQCKWDTVIDLKSLFTQYLRVLKSNKAIVLTAQQPFTSKLVMTAPDLFKYDWVWKKPKGTGHLNANKQPMRDKEDILVFSNGKTPYYPQLISGTPYKNKAGKDHTSSSSMTDSYGVYKNFRNDNDGKRYPKQVLEFGVVGRGSVHPTQKPVELMEYMIKTYTLPGEVVLDNTMGSGTTGVASIKLARNFIGMELDATYFDHALTRIKEVA